MRIIINIMIIIIINIITIIITITLTQRVEKLLREATLSKKVSKEPLLTSVHHG